MRLNLTLAVLLVLAVIVSLLAGKVWISPADWLGGDLSAIIIAQLRLPRALVGVIVGAGLGGAGAAMQGYLRNPLADPGLFGVSACAALGAVLAMFLGLSAVPMMLPLCALVGAAAGMGLLSMLVGRSASLVLFTLAGVVLSSLAGALTALLISLAPTPFAASEIVTWLMGALTDRSWTDVSLSLPPVTVGLALLMLAGRSLDALTLGEAAARSLGVDMTRLLSLMVFGVGLCVGATVAVAGVIGFVGLVVPHIVRPLAGHRPGALILPSALAGALLVVVADALVRILPSVSELRLGIAMSLLGTPFFLWLLMRMRRELA